MRYILVDIADRGNFYPFSLTQSLANIRVGIYTIQERWEQYLQEACGIYTAPYLQVLFDDNAFLKTEEALYFINITCLPNEPLIAQINALKEGEKLMSETGKWIATKSKERSFQQILLATFPPIIYNEVSFVQDQIHLLSLHAKWIERDLQWVKANRKSQPIDSSNKVVQPDQIFIEEGASVLCSNLNASEGPIYIGKEAIIMEGVSIRGPFVLGQKGVVKMNTSIYGATTIGPYCLAGGEIKNAILLGYSNKGHEGYLGDSIIGHWCNIGAGTCNSNIKNTAGMVQMWNEFKQEWEEVGQKMGMLMGDYSRFAIQSSINTGSYIGVSANIFGNGLLPKHLPNFTWGILPGYQYDKAVSDLSNWKKLKGFTVSEAEKLVLKHLYLESNSA
ncbi:MAG: putative sugar nucleotidyl transferase [Chitinophagia bacterium]|jgi:UDP-N-acetylglucosamine diphosphorylase / glucose-1-phosphate thymidylyltransferase / UDP-N-acetylgalactosamine diphosphorylase / glucosamine-1-phosphate N-acetyltransferase / galactosamine-1-phosphate N-acetyltransferase